MKNCLLIGLVLMLTPGCVAKKKYLAMEGQYTDCSGQVTSLEGELEGCKATSAMLDAERQKLMGDRAQLGESLAQMELALKELKRREAKAEARVAEFQQMLKKFKKLIDAGTLQVKIVDGRMVVQLATDVLFASGQASLSEAGKQTIKDVTAVLVSIEERDYQIEGHTDNVPIATAQYPSNWVLASARALTVVQTMIDAEMPAERVSAASFGDTRPVASNETDDGRSENRRIEIVILPDLSGLPGFSELQALSE